MHSTVLDKVRKRSEVGRLYSQNFTPQMDKNKQIYGNLSIFAKNWVNGPNH